MKQIQPAQTYRQIPPELLRSAPRDCRLTRRGMLTLGVAVVLFLGAIAFTVGASLSNMRTKALKREMADSGMLATGTVVKTYRTGDDDKRDVFLYEFRAMDRTYSGRTDISVKHSPHYEVGSSISVRYLPSRPEKSWIAGYAPGEVPLFVIPLVAGACLFGGYSVYAKLRRQQELVSEGRAVLARVLKVKRVRYGGVHGAHSTHRAEVEFPLLNGSVQKARVDLGRRAPSADSTLVIVYDRENPKKVLRYPACFVRLEKPEVW